MRKAAIRRGLPTPPGDTKPQKVMMEMRACHHGEPCSVTDKGGTVAMGKGRLDTQKARDSFLSWGDAGNSVNDQWMGLISASLGLAM